jgi:hypothetical protein
MGLSIHYSGYLLNKEMLEPLIEEVADICKTLGWPTHFYNDDEIEGVSFAPKKSEPVFLTFNSDGRALSPTNLMIKNLFDGVRFDKELMYFTSTKTQYAGMDAHIAIIKLLKYLSAKYMKDFILSDEGYYWETGDEKILAGRFKEYNAMLNAVTEAFTNMKSIPGETPESLGERIERILKEKLRGFNDGQ